MSDITFVDSPDFHQTDSDKILDPIQFFERAELYHGPNVWLRGFDSTEVLTAEQERGLFRQFNYLKFLASRSDDELRARSLQKQALAVRNTLVRANYRILIFLALAEYRRRRQGFPDLLSEASLQMIESAESFDYSRGFKFSTYYTRALEHRFRRYFSRERRRKFQFDEFTVEICSRSPKRSAGPGDHLELSDELMALLAELPARDRDIIERRYGLNNRCQETQRQIASTRGVTKSLIQQMEARAIGRIRTFAGIPTAPNNQV